MSLDSTISSKAAKILLERRCCRNCRGSGDDSARAEWLGVDRVCAVGPSLRAARPALRIALTLLAAASLLPCCVGVRIGAREDFFRVKGLASAHASVNGLDEWDGSLLDIGILGYAREGELVSVDVGPFAGAGVGVVGARARVLPLSVGVGTLFYDPRPPRPKKRKPEVEPPPPAAEPDDRPSRPAESKRAATDADEPDPRRGAEPDPRRGDEPDR